ncbi:adenine deaminase [Youngiibacter fragilis]|uniref:Adenine deaminase n=1 Tax=Youngiibacter fragilis 232.1 TaxID=994573 RepID=V7IA04_9CLOT|nr:adenine deaminase [Youngiibacter fragilis]ETA82116.1 adenine deaminase [Youngiibacter fragilis 232.1]
MDINTLTSLIKASNGEIPCDLSLQNAKVVDVFSGKILETGIGIKDGYIVGYGDYEGDEVTDLDGAYVSPSLIDSHIHVESTVSTCRVLSEAACMHGIGSMVADPHEIANVLGSDGILYMLDSSEGLPVDFYFMLSSCVPSTKLETSGAVLKSSDLLPLYDSERVLGLAEVMDMPSVAGCDEDMLKKLLAARNRGLVIDGHGSELTKRGSNIFRTAGISTDHECVTSEEAMDRLSKGMYIHIREGTAAKNFDAIIGLVDKDNLRRFTFCTDDMHIDELHRNGSIDALVRRAIAFGLEPVDAIRMATINPSECYGLRESGAIAPGYRADFIVLESLSDFRIRSVYKRGLKVYGTDGVTFDFSSAIPPPIMSTMNFRELKASSFKMDIPGTGTVNLMEIIKNSLLTRHHEISMGKSSDFMSDITNDIIKIGIVERHKNTGNVALGLVRGFRLHEGAVASSVSHDSHNIIVIGTNDQDMASACNRLRETGGGIAIYSHGKMLAELPLEIAGLMSGRPLLELIENVGNLKNTAQVVFDGLDFDPFLTLSFLALPVIPEIKITDKGLYSSSLGRFIGLFN